MSDVTDFIGAAVADKPVAALKAFSAAMEPRISGALDNRYSEVSNQVFNPQEVADDVEVEAEAATDEVEIEEPEQDLETEMEEPQDVWYIN